MRNMMRISSIAVMMIGLCFLSSCCWFCDSWCEDDDPAVTIDQPRPGEAYHGGPNTHPPRHPPSTPRYPPTPTRPARPTAPSETIEEETHVETHIIEEGPYESGD